MELDLEINKAIEKIHQTKAKLVCLQLPDGLKPLASEIKDKLENKTGAEILIWLGSCYGACDTAAVDKLGVDLLIQFGHKEI